MSVFNVGDRVISSGRLVDQVTGTVKKILPPDSHYHNQDLKSWSAIDSEWKNKSVVIVLLDRTTKCVKKENCPNFDAIPSCGINIYDIVPSYDALAFPESDLYNNNKESVEQ